MSNLILSITFPIVILAILIWLKIDGIKVFAIKGIPFIISRIFIAFFGGIFGVSLLAGGFSDALEFSLIISMAYGSVVIHEYSHAITALYYGYKTKKIVIYPFSGIAFLDTESINKHTHEFWISLAGPLSNIIQAIVIYPFLDYGIHYLNLYFEINVGLAAFNLLVPVYPMDGGRVVHSLITWCKKDKIETALYTCVFSTLAATLSVYVLWNIGQYFASGIVCLMASVSWLEYFSLRKKEKRISATLLLCDTTEQLVSLMKSEIDARKEAGQEAGRDNDVIINIKLKQIEYMEKTVAGIRKNIEDKEVDRAFRRVISINDSLKDMDRDIKFALELRGFSTSCDPETALACQQAVKELNQKKFGVT